MKKLFLALTVLLLGIAPAKAQNATESFTLPKLNYTYEALEPVIDAKTMETHLTKHHQGYVDKLNAEVEKSAELKNKSIDAIIANISSYNTTVRNNAGGHWNHSFFWNVMAPKDQTGQISPALLQAINTKFGSLDKFKEAFEKAGASQFGSGWVWLIVKKDKTLDVVSTPNQDNPLMDDAPVKGTPILGNDVWEHAYYLNYQNKRSDYLKNWWNVVNWTKVSEHYSNATK